MVRERKPGQRMSRTEAAALGWGTGAPVDPTRQMQFEGMETHDSFRRLPRWEDLPDKRRGNVKSRTEIAAGLQEDFGVTHRGMRASAGAILDRAKQEAIDSARSRGATGMEALDAPIPGQDFYGVTERARIADRARNFGLYTGSNDPARPHLDRPRGGGTDYDTAAAMVAVQSPQVAWQDRTPEGTVRYPNIDIAEEVAYQEDNPTGSRLSTSAGLRANAYKSARIYGGEDPHDVLGGKKVESFYQNLTHPYREDARATVDVHMVRSLTGLPDDVSPVMLSRKGGYEAVDRAIREAASERGIMPEEAQSVIWHQAKRESDAGARYDRFHDYTRERRSVISERQMQLDV